MRTGCEETWSETMVCGASGLCNTTKDRHHVLKLGCGRNMDEEECKSKRNGPLYRNSATLPTSFRYRRQ